MTLGGRKLMEHPLLGTKAAAITKIQTRKYAVVSLNFGHGAITNKSK